MGKKLLYILLFLNIYAQAQIEQRILFSQAIGENIRKYKLDSQRAYYHNNFERAEFLFDSLIENVANGSHLDNFRVKEISGKEIELYKFKKPIFLMTYASWCAPGIGEIPALNEVAETHYKDIDFVIIFWDSKESVRKLAKEYSRKINIVYVDEKENRSNHIIQVLKHSLGFPTSFFVDKHKTIVDIKRGTLHPYNEIYETSFELNHNSFLNGVSILKSTHEEEKNRLALKENP